MSTAHNEDDLARRLATVTRERDEDRGSAPHKPLMILAALILLHRQDETRPTYQALQELVDPLLKALGRDRGASMPFTYLTSDRIWSLDKVEGVRRRKSQGADKDYLHPDLLKAGATGGFSPDILDSLLSNPDLRRRMIRLVLERYFNDADQAKIRTGLGLA